jgi:hypothetical protein
MLKDKPSESSQHPTRQSRSELVTLPRWAVMVVFDRGLDSERGDPPVSLRLPRNSPLRWIYSAPPAFPGCRTASAIGARRRSNPSRRAANPRLPAERALFASGNSRSPCHDAGGSTRFPWPCARSDVGLSIRRAQRALLSHALFPPMPAPEAGRPALVAMEVVCRAERVYRPRRRARRDAQRGRSRTARASGGAALGSTSRGTTGSSGTIR